MSMTIATRPPAPVATSILPTVAIIDIDGVAYDQVTPIGDQAALMFGQPRQDFPPAETWDFFTDWGFSTAEFLVIYRAAILSGRFGRHGVPLPGAVDGWQRLRSAGVYIVVATDAGCDGARDEAQAARLAWLSDWGFEADEIRFTSDKAAVAAEFVSAGHQVFAIDDRPKNFEALAATGCSAYLAWHRYNRDHVAHLLGHGVLDLGLFAEIVVASRA